MKKKIAFLLCSVIILLSMTGCKKIIRKIDDPMTPDQYKAVISSFDGYGMTMKEEVSDTGVESVTATSETNKDIVSIYYICMTPQDADNCMQYLRESMVQIFGGTNSYEKQTDNALIAENDVQKCAVIRDRNVVICTYSTDKSANAKVDEIVDKLDFSLE